MSYRVRRTIDVDGQRRTQQYLTEEVFAALSDARRRVLISILSERALPLSEGTLATHIVAREQSKAIDDVTADERESVRATLHHHHLPKLEELDLVERRHDGGTVIADGAPAFDDVDLLEIPEEMPSTVADELFDALASDPRRAILAVLEERTSGTSTDADAITVEALADAVGSDESDDGTAAFRAADSTRMDIALHHRHLPKLAEAGLVDYDRDEGTVAYVGHSFLQTDWLTRGPALRSER